MRITRDVRAFLEDPVDACVVAASWAVWCRSPSLCGAVAWGVPTPEEVTPLAEVLDFVCQPPFAAVDILLDNRRIERVDTDALMAFGARVMVRLPEWARRIRRLAAILPDGLPGMLVAGILPSLQPPFPFRFTHAPADAWAFLEHPELAATVDEVERAIAQARGSSLLLDRLRAHLERALQHPSLAAAATALGLSTRSLQRELLGLETSFSDEVRKARIGAATELLRSTDTKIDAIALRVGFSSSSKMSAAFRAEVGLTPSQLRANQRVK